MAKWLITITSRDGSQRSIDLDHECETEEEAYGEAEDIADREFTVEDEFWELAVKIG